MKDLFEIAGGTVLGREHLRLGKNNQDAFAFKVVDDYAIMAIVCDGCSAGAHTEVGAKLGASIAIESLFSNLAEWGIDGENVYVRFFWDRLRERILSRVSYATRSMDGEFKRTIGDYFLFTIVGALILPEVTAIFSIGDGIIGINERLIKIGPFPNNQPPYLAYSLLDQSLTGFSPDELRFTVHSVTPTNEVQTVLIGTDGVMDLSRAFPLNQFWDNDLYFKNPDAVRRRLALMNKESVKIDWEKGEVNREGGLLPDDTTLVVIRRKK